jgi:hypothetical protein
MKTLLISTLKRPSTNTYLVLLVWLIFLLGFSLSLSAQKPFKKDIYKARVLESRTKLISTGYLYQLQDSSILISHSEFKPIIVKMDLIEIQKIDCIRVRKKGKIGKGILYGGLAGFAIGAITGFASGDDPSGFLSFTAEQKGVMLGTFFMIPGAIIGGIIGAQTIKIPINKNQKIYAKQKKELKKYLVK